jgi:hypothetical protein
MSRVFESPDGPPGPARIIDLYCGYMISQTVFAAVEFGLFAAAGPEPATPVELAERCGIPGTQRPGDGRPAGRRRAAGA